MPRIGSIEWWLDEQVSPAELVELLRDLAPDSPAWVACRDRLCAEDSDAYGQWLAYMQRQREALREIADP